MKISFVIPAYNEEAYLGNCLKSLLEELKATTALGLQFESEIIVVNNASSDRTKEVALAFPGVRVVDEMRKGLSSARQAGFSASSGELIANIDADTRMPADWLKKVLAYFSADQELVALSGPHIFYDISKTVVIATKFWYKIASFGNKYFFRKTAIVQGGNFVLKRAALEKIGGFDTKFEFYGEDTDIARRISKVGKVLFTLDLPIYASGRRMAGEGPLLMGFKYAMNFIWTSIFSKPFSKSFKDIRK